MLIFRELNKSTYYIFNILRRVFYMGGTPKGGVFSQCYTVLSNMHIHEFWVEDQVAFIQENYSKYNYSIT